MRLQQNPCTPSGNPTSLAEKVLSGQSACEETQGFQFWEGFFDQTGNSFSAHVLLLQQENTRVETEIEA